MFRLIALVTAFSVSLAAAPSVPPAVRVFLSAHCIGCHNANLRQGNLDLSSLPFQLSDQANFDRWVRIHDRVRDGEMPPVHDAKLTDAARKAFVDSLEVPLVGADRARYAPQGRTVERRLNRYEYENTLRDLLGAPWLQVRDMLPEDGEKYRFNKSGEALDISHVQMSQYLAAADYALREVLPKTAAVPKSETKRFYARDQRSFTGGIVAAPDERSTFAVLGDGPDIPAMKHESPMSVGAAKPEIREKEAVGVVASAYEPIEPKFNQFKAPVSGRYRIRLKAHSFWVGNIGGEKRWWKPNPELISRGRTTNP